MERTSENEVRARHVGIAEVARAAGVSIATVSRVLNGSAKVTSALRARVLEAVSTLGYRPNPHARALHSGRSHAIGVMVTGTGGSFYDLLFKGLEEKLSAFGYRLLFASGEYGREAEIAVLHDMLDRHVDGLVVYPETISNQELIEIASEGTPMFILGRMIPGLEERCLTFDQRQGGYLATHHLIEMGHKAIAHISGPLKALDARLRLEGYHLALRNSSLPARPEWVAQGGFSEKSGYEGMKALLACGGFSAVFAANDQMAIGALAALWEAGIAVPDEMSVVGFDDQVGARYAIPPLTTVRQPLDALGRAAALRFLDIFSGSSRCPAKLPELELIARASVRRGVRP